MMCQVSSNRVIGIFIVLFMLAGSGNAPADTGSSLCINEFMASNSSTVADPQGKYEDWIEIYNKGDKSVSLTGMYLSDDPAEPTKWQFPDITIEPGAFLMIWADEDIEDDGIHADFKLSASGEAIGLFNADQSVIDTVTFEAQSENISFGRYPDGSDNWQSFTSPSPGKSNTDALSGDTDGNGTLDMTDAILTLKKILTASLTDDTETDDENGLQKLINVLRELSGYSDTSENTRTQGWTEETHGNDAEPNYDAVFSDDKVRKIELVIDPADWQAMMDDMTDIYGQFGAGENQSQGNNNQQPQQGTAADACVGKNEGDACEMTMGGQTVSGSCMTNRGQLSCSVGNPGITQPPGDNQMSQGASDACTGKSEGDACETTMGDQTVSGSCVTDRERLVCRAGSMGGGEIPGGNIDAGGGAAIDMSGGRNPIWKPCTLKFEDKVWYHVGVRFKGNSSLTSTWKSGIWKLPMRFDFDQFEDDYPEIENQRFFGFKKLSLASNYRDSSLLREKVVADIFRAAGVPAPRTAFYRLYVDHGNGLEYFGLYTMVEIPADTMLEKNFGNSDGNLYKPEGTGATFATYDEASFDKESNEDEADWSDVKALFDALHSDRSDAAAWRASLEKTLNVDGFLRWLAVNMLIQNWDTYGRMSHNYYLYNNSADGLLNWIPWDNNEALKGSDGAGIGGGAISLSLAEATDSWPLIRYLADDPTYRAKYVSYIEETARGSFEPEKMKAIYKAASELIRPYTVGDEGEKQGYTFLNNAAEFDTAIESLNTHVDSRYNEALQFLTENR